MSNEYGKTMKRLILSFGLAILITACKPQQTVYLSDLDLSYMTSGWGTPKVDSSVTGTPLSIAGVVYERGVGSHASSEMAFVHDGSAGRFTAMVGLDDNASDTGSVEFFVFTDRGVAFSSGVMRTGDPAMPVDVNLRGVHELFLIATTTADGQAYDHANWADAQFKCNAVPQPTDCHMNEEPYLLTPPAASTPRINGAKVYGVTPGKPFIFRIAATGERPMNFSAKDLPEGLILNAETGIITGTSPVRGEYNITITASNSQGACVDTLKIVSGDKLALTPHMGWNSWYIHLLGVTQKDMEDAAQAMVSSGLADYGYCFVNIDDGWMVKVNSDDPIIGGPLRDKDGTILCNKNFPNMRAFTDLVHSLGLKAGLYTSPGTSTCGGYAGALHHEEQDAKTFAEWGFDFLKYDWCSYGSDTKNESDDPDYFRKPYRKMNSYLRKLPRDIIYNLCQYGMDNVWEWGAEVGGQSWRTRGDIGGPSLVDNMFSMGFFQGTIKDYSGPGGWNDPDYLLFGDIYDFQTGGTKRSDLSPSEQYTCMTLWCMISAPLIFSGDITTLDEFTLNVLCNAEVIAVDQDPLGKSGYCVSDESMIEVWEKPLADGSWAVSVFNRRPTRASVEIDWGKLGYGEVKQVRDLWRQVDMGDIHAVSKLDIPRHGCMMFKMVK